MRYVITKEVMEPVPEVEISAEEYSSLQQARGVLSRAFDAEQKYDFLIANFLEFEKELLHIGATNIVRRTLTYEEFSATISALSVRMLNLLTTARLYLDSLPQDVPSCVPEKPDAAELLKAACSREYDEHFEYRFMEALRNSAQHWGMNILVSSDGRWTSMGDDGLLEFTVDIAIRRRYLEENPKFKKKVLAEISGDKVDLKAASRCYVECLSAIHTFARELIHESVDTARWAIKTARKHYEAVYSDSLAGIAARAVRDDATFTSVPLHLEWDDVRIALQKRNAPLKNLRKQYVTGKTGCK